MAAQNIYSDLPTEPFGRTGHSSTRIIFGAAALAAMSQQRADATLELISEAGINHIDTAASYGESELRLAPWLADHRSEVFLATKTGDRTGPEARASLERSLTRMGADHVDMIQLHNLVEPDEWDVVHRPGGALEALVAAQQEGLVRHIGVTGHGLRIAAMHVRSLDEYDYASVLLPVNPSLMAFEQYRDDVDRLRDVCGQRQVAMQTIKAIARRRWPDDAEGPKFSWYEPLTNPDAIARAVRFVLAEPHYFLNTSSDARLLPALLSAVADHADPDTQRFVAPAAAELAEDSQAMGVLPIFDGSELERI